MELLRKVADHVFDHAVRLLELKRELELLRKVEKKASNLKRQSQKLLEKIRSEG